MNKKIILITAISVITIVLGIIIIVFLLNKKPLADGIIINKEDTTYQNILLKSYNEYVEILKKYKVSDKVLLTNNDLKNNDYIIDFIDYEDTLNIKKIDINITEVGVEITYNVNKEIKNSDKYLMYFIPIKKGLLHTLNIANRKVLAA